MPLLNVVLKRFWSPDGGRSATIMKVTSPIHFRIRTKAVWMWILFFGVPIGIAVLYMIYAWIFG